MTLTQSTLLQPPHVPNLGVIPLREIPVLPLEDFRTWLANQLAEAGHLCALFGRPIANAAVRLYAVVGQPLSGMLAVCAADVSERYPALTPDCPQAHWFEREIAEQWGVVPEGHPWLKPIRFHESYRPGHDAWGRAVGAAISPCVQPPGTDYFRVKGHEIHEVAVGPIHAGVIEPGHFRFQCHGEHVYHLEIELGFQHRGVEQALMGGPNKRTLHLMETLAGDTSIGHATAYCQAVESLSGTEAPIRAQVLRGVALELERLANHTGDLGALATDVGFLPTSSFCGRLRGDYLNTTAMLCGNRFGRSFIQLGGIGFDVDGLRAEQMTAKLKTALDEVAGAAQLLWKTPSVLARFESTGTVSLETAQAIGLVGPAGRACGIDRDVRRDYAAGIYRFAQIPVTTWHTGDVFARAYIRWLEIERSARFVMEQLRSLPAGPVSTDVSSLQADSLVVSLVEGWRGEICHVAITDAAGRFAQYKVVDPSFHNWIGLMMSLRDQQISDFPLCNKSYNLSYCGHDL